MTTLLSSLLVLAVGAVGSIIFGRTRLLLLGPFAAVVGGALAALSGLQTLLSGAVLELSLPWPVPLGTFHLGLDPLSAVFSLLIGVIGGLAAIFGRGYLAGRPADGKVGASWCWYNILMAAMLLVTTARDGFLFLVAWEIMTLASFFLVMFDGEKEETIRAGWTYLVAAHLGEAFLLAMFLLLSPDGGMDFNAFSASGPRADFIFVAALIGFGVKAGFVPLHVWLPEAHPAAPSHVSALMSGVMIKTGIYGILRVMTFLGPPAAWWGWTLIVIGVVSGVMGVLFALAQHDLKRLLAYHSVENIGIIALGLGLGVLGAASGRPVMASLGLCGGLLHVLNHGLFKSLLFLGAGSVLRAAGIRDLDRLGGLIKRMPVTGAAFLVGAAAISALPPFNGFVSEFLIYSSALTGLTDGGGFWAGLTAVAGLSLIGGLAAACFTKAFGIVFLGEPRTREASEAREAPVDMLIPMIILALLCSVIGLAAPWMVRLVLPAVVQIAPQAAAGTAGGGTAIDLLTRVSLAVWLLAGLAGILVLLRKGLLRGRPREETGTWDCGYAAPTARMQYTASSFAQPIVGMFRAALQTHYKLNRPRELFPAAADFHSHTPDVFVHGFFAPAVASISKFAVWFRLVQPGRTHLYVLYIVITILVLLTWTLW
ncbi:MAG: proton-conducting transporter membrane subunit [Pseudomonadota bacterium]